MTLRSGEVVSQRNRHNRSHLLPDLANWRQFTIDAVIYVWIISKWLGFELPAFLSTVLQRSAARPLGHTEETNWRIHGHEHFQTSGDYASMISDRKPQIQLSRSADRESSSGRSTRPHPHSLHLCGSTQYYQQNNPSLRLNQPSPFAQWWTLAAVVNRLSVPLISCVTIWSIPDSRQNFPWNKLKECGERKKIQRNSVELSWLDYGLCCSE